MFLVVSNFKIVVNMIDYHFNFRSVASSVWGEDVDPTSSCTG